MIKPLTDTDINIVLENTVRDMDKEDLKKLGGKDNPFLRLSVRISLLTAMVNEIAGVLNFLTDNECKDEETLH